VSALANQCGKKRDSPDSPKAPDLAPANPGFEDQMDLADEIMRADREVLRDLSK
jgi:hypothetical protein